MATKIVTKNSSTASSVPTASDLVQGELAVNVADKRLFTEDNAGAIVELGTNPSGNVTFQDNGKAIFGAGSDLQIYHDGNNSRIVDAGTGYLKIQATDRVAIRSADDSTKLADFYTDGAVKLYYANAEKLATTSTGIDVTGSVTADDLIKVATNGTSAAEVDIVSAATWRLRSNPTSGTNSYGLDIIKGSAGTDVKMSIDSSGNVGIGTSTFTGANAFMDDLVVYNATAGTGAGLSIIGNATNGYSSIAFGDTADWDTGRLQYNHADNSMAFHANSAERFRIASDGSLSTPTLGTSNVRFGVNAGNSIIAGGNYNTVVGDEAGTAITTGEQNVIIGAFAGDALTDANFNVALGLAALSADTLGSRSTAIGHGALENQNFTSATDTYNTAVGYVAGLSITTGTLNTLIGGLAGDAITTASNNTAVGSYSLTQNTTGASNVALGVSALGYNTTASNNTAVGYDALKLNTTGAQNTALGANSLQANTTGTRNTSVGQGSGYTATTGSDNSFLGLGAGYGFGGTNTASYNTALGSYAGFRLTSGSNNTAVGYNSLTANTTGIQNVAVGAESAEATTTGNYNVAIGYRSLEQNTTGSQNVAIGRSAMESNTTAGDNTAVGFAALEVNTTGHNNTAVGKSALVANSTGIENVAVGSSSLGNNTTGVENTAVGQGALYSNTTASYNTAVGKSALAANTTGTRNTALGCEAAELSTASDNVAIGYKALDTTTSGSNNTAVGTEAMDANTTGSANVAVGYRALDANTIASYNTAIGQAALGSNTTGYNNVAVGALAGDEITTGILNTGIGGSALGKVTTGQENVAVGQGSGQSLTTQSQCTFVGRDSGDACTGSGNTLLGYKTGAFQTNLLSGTANTIVGAYCDTTAATSTNAMGLGYNIDCAAGYTTLGAGSTDSRLAHGGTTWAAVSDQRYKKDIVDSTAGLSFINALQPRTFNYRTLGELPETFTAYEEGSTEVFKSSQTQHGFIAQEIKAAIDADDSIKDGFKLWDDREDGSQEVAEAALIPVLVKAVQELSTQLDAALARIETLEG